jgi:hypothetical protein
MYQPYGQNLPYAQVPQYTGGMGGPQVARPVFKARRRINIIALAMGLFVPWLVFCLIFAMLSFHMHFQYADVCQVISIVVGVSLVGGIVFSLFTMLRQRLSEGGYGDREPSVGLFVCTTALVAFIVATYLGDHNYRTTMVQTYDLLSLNTYEGVDPALMRGQGLMDAGQVRFAEGAQPLLSKAIGFRNEDTYCVAPITGGIVNDVPLTTYDFWAVGTNCCSSTSTGAGADFHCGAVNASNARGGIRVVGDDQRAFYRLAVQQAESAFQIKAIHPLFFHWVLDPEVEINILRREGFQFYFIGMLAYFGFQICIVGLAMSIFSGSLQAAL